MDTGTPFSGPGEAGGSAALSWAYSPYSGHGLTRIGRGLSVDSGASRIRVRLFRTKNGELVVRIVGHCQATVPKAAVASGSIVVHHTRVTTESDADGCVITVAHASDEKRWERETLRWSDGTVHSVASPAVRELETAGRALHEKDAQRPARRRGLFGG